METFCSTGMGERSGSNIRSRKLIDGACSQDPAVILIDQPRRTRDRRYRAMVPPRSCARTSPSACSQRKRADDLDQQFYENYVCGAERNFGDKRKLDELIDGQSIEPDREKPDKSSGRSKGGWPKTMSARSSSMPVNPPPETHRSTGRTARDAIESSRACSDRTRTRHPECVRARRLRLRAQGSYRSGLRSGRL